jgi:hypothetical protein
MLSSCCGDISVTLWRHGGSTEVKVPYILYHGTRWRSLVNILPRRNTSLPADAGYELSIRADLDIVKWELNSSIVLFQNDSCIDETAKS